MNSLCNPSCSACPLPLPPALPLVLPVLCPAVSPCSPRGGATTVNATEAPSLFASGAEVVLLVSGMFGSADRLSLLPSLRIPANLE